LCGKITAGEDLRGPIYILLLPEGGGGLKEVHLYLFSQREGDILTDKSPPFPLGRGE